MILNQRRGESLTNKENDFSGLLEYRDSLLQQPQTPFQKIAMDIVGKAIENLKNKTRKI